MSGKTIMPGMINAHAHLNIDSELKTPVRDQLLQRLRTYADLRRHDRRQPRIDPGRRAGGLKLRDEQDRGTLDRARIYTGGVNAVGKTPEEARKSVDRLADLKVDIIKYHINGNPNDMTPDVYGALVDEAHKRGLRTARPHLLSEGREGRAGQGHRHHRAQRARPGRRSARSSPCSRPGTSATSRR